MAKLPGVGRIHGAFHPPRPAPRLILLAESGESLTLFQPLGVVGLVGEGFGTSGRAAGRPARYTELVRDRGLVRGIT